VVTVVSFFVVCVAVCCVCRFLKREIERESVLKRDRGYDGDFCCSVPQCVAVCCSVLSAMHVREDVEQQGTSVCVCVRVRVHVRVRVRVCVRVRVRVRVCVRAASMYAILSFKCVIFVCVRENVCARVFVQCDTFTSVICMRVRVWM